MGKTVQMLALCLAHQQPLRMAPVGSMLQSGRAALGVLIVCPFILVKQWEQEIRTKVAPPFGGNVCIHHGPSRAKRGVQLAAYDFVITTYDVVRSEHRVAAAAAERGGGGALFQLRWFRAILDEAHTIKNRDSACSVACRWPGAPLHSHAEPL